MPASETRIESNRANSLEPAVEARNEPNAWEAVASEVVEEPAVPPATPVDAAPPRTRETGSAPAQPARVASPSDRARNEANAPKVWNAEQEADLAELDAYVDGLCPA